MHFNDTALSTPGLHPQTHGVPGSASTSPSICPLEETSLHPQAPLPESFCQWEALVRAQSLGRCQEEK